MEISARSWSSFWGRGHVAAHDKQKGLPRLLRPFDTCFGCRRRQSSRQAHSAIIIPPPNFAPVPKSPPYSAAFQVNERRIMRPGHRQMDGWFWLGRRDSAHHKLDQERIHPLGDGTSCSSPRHCDHNIFTADCCECHAESAGSPWDTRSQSV
jgi:hypothetical protein